MLENISKIKEIINNAPKDPGVYSFLDANQKVLYVGKASKLKERLKFYIDKSVLNKYPKTLKMVSQAFNLKYFTVDTEVEALVLEAALIKKYKPKYNIDLKDDKSYGLIEIIKDEFGSYRLRQVRKRTKNGVYFGPFPSGTDVNYVLRNIRKLIPYRDCNKSKYKYYKSVNRPCLYGYIGLCPAPCQGANEIQENNQNIEKIKKFLGGKSKSVIKDLYRDMKQYSNLQEYEKANAIKKRLNHYEYMSKKYQNEVELLANVGDIGTEDYKVKELLEILSGYFEVFKLKKDDESYHKTFRIEYFDISNLGTSIIVAASTCTVGGVINKKYYRKYKIKNSSGTGMIEYQNDFEAMGQLLKRRVLNDDKWGKADLFVIDGGKGQLSAVLNSLELLNYKIPVIALAKKEEEIYLKNEGKFIKLRLPKNSTALSILIKGRDEVHRFGVTFNRSLRVLKNP